MVNMWTRGTPPWFYETACTNLKQLLSEAAEIAVLAEAVGHAVNPDDLGGGGEGI
jgi:hypothetical protein